MVPEIKVGCMRDGRWEMPVGIWSWRALEAKEKCLAFKSDKHYEVIQFVFINAQRRLHAVE